MSPELKRKILATQRLHGWCMLDKAEHLALLVQDSTPAKIVEIGVYGGRSLIPMALAAQTYGGSVYGIDPWKNEACLEGTQDPANAKWWGDLDLEMIYQHAKEAINAFGVADVVRLMRMTDTEALGHFGDEEIGVLHVDGNHSAEVSQRYIKEWGPKIEPGGYLIMDDTDWPSQAETVKLIESHYARVTVKPSWAIYRKE